MTIAIGLGDYPIATQGQLSQRGIDLKSDQKKGIQMSAEIPKRYLSNLLVQVMLVEKHFAHEQVGAKSDRRTEIKKIVNKVAAEMISKKGESDIEPAAD